MSQVMRRKVSVCVLVLLVVLFSGLAAAEFSNPYHANIAGVDYVTDDGIEFTFWVTIYSEDDTGDSEPLRWEAWDDNETVLISHEIEDPIVEEGTPRLHSEATYTVPEDIDILVFRGYDSEHGYGGATVTVDFAAQDFRPDDPEAEESEGEGTEEETGEGGADGPAAGGSPNDTEEDVMGGTEETGEVIGDETLRERGENIIGDRIGELLPGAGDDTEETGPGGILFLLLLGGLAVVAFIGYGRYRA